MTLELWDVCKNRHGGNAESAAAFQSVKDSLSLTQESILMLIRLSDSGLTVDELCVKINRTPNQISGRVTELKIKGLIRKNGTRLTRSGNPAAILIAT